MGGEEGQTDVRRLSCDEWLFLKYKYLITLLAGCLVINIYVNIRLLQHTPDRDVILTLTSGLWFIPLYALLLFFLSFSILFSFLAGAHLKEVKGLISPGENIPSDEEQSKTRQQESWDLHFHTMCDE